MAAAGTAVNPHLAALLAGQGSLPPSPLGRLNTLRAAALERARSLTLPTSRDEDWRFSDPALLTRHSFQPAETPSAITFAAIEAATFSPSAPVA